MYNIVKSACASNDGNNDSVFRWRGASERPSRSRFEDTVILFV